MRERAHTTKISSTTLRSGGTPHHDKKHSARRRTEGRHHYRTQCPHVLAKAPDADTCLVSHHMRRIRRRRSTEVDTPDRGRTRGSAGVSHCRHACGPFSKRPDLDKTMPTHQSNAVVQHTERSHETLYGRALPRQNRTCQFGSSVTDTRAMPKNPGLYPLARKATTHKSKPRVT